MELFLFVTGQIPKLRQLDSIYLKSYYCHGVKYNDTTLSETFPPPLNLVDSICE